MIDCLLWEPSHGITSFTPSTVHLKALRKLELDESSTPFAHTNIIECPSLTTFTISNYENFPWGLPSWIPAGISELNVRGATSSSSAVFTF